MDPPFISVLCSMWPRYGSGAGGRRFVNAGDQWPSVVLVLRFIARKMKYVWDFLIVRPVDMQAWLGVLRNWVNTRRRSTNQRRLR